MLDLVVFFFYVFVDVSSVKFLCIWWFFRGKNKYLKEKIIWKYKSCFVYDNDICLVCWVLEKNRVFVKKNNYRVMDDIRESIKEFKYYKENIFKVNKGRRWGLRERGYWDCCLGVIFLNVFFLYYEI